MADDLGARLVQAGLVTPHDLAEVLGAAPPHEAALVRALVRRGLSEDAIVGFFIASGFGPLMDAAELAAADPRALHALSPTIACELVALPVRASPAGLIVAMAAPTDAHALGELRRAVGGEVLPAVARESELSAALARAYPGGERPRSAPPPLESEPPVLELVRRRKQEDAELMDRFVGSTRGAERVEARGLVGPKLVLEDDETFVPLVRQKPVPPPKLPPPPSTSLEAARAASKVVTKSFEKPSAAAIEAERRRAESEARPPAPAPERSIIPLEHARWDVEAPANKVDAGKLRTISSPPKRGSRPAPAGGTLAAIRASRDRDEVAQLACKGALAVAGAAILLALRKTVLKGWDGAGRGITRDAVRNLWIPTNSPSMFRDVVARAEPYEGPHRASAADGLFRAAVMSRGGVVSIQPITIAGKTVAVLAADDVGYEREGRERIEILARAVAEAFERIIVESKRR